MQLNYHGGLKRYKQIALVTDDFSIYHSIIEEARSRKLYIEVITPGHPIPPHIGAVITTEAEYEKIDFSRHRILVAEPDNPGFSIDKAVFLISGDDIEQIIIGIDPGKYPGMALVANNKIISVYHVQAGDVCPLVKKIMQTYQEKNIIVRIGNGARLIRSRLINDLLDLGLRVEMVDETGTSPRLGKGIHGREISDIIAAINIANIPGKMVGKQYIEPSLGEVRIVQEHSREHSNGRVTIPRPLARKVAKGEITLDEAIEKHTCD
ncbi:MAG: hypothetical protein ACNA7I_02330 [Candidatus Methanoperedens sp.]|nr:hypothetical protein [Candidatus Methanoperedens sp.]